MTALVRHVAYCSLVGFSGTAWSAAANDAHARFESVAEAYATVSAAAPSSRSESSPDWWVFDYAGARWSFARGGHPAFPVLIRRTPTTRDDGTPVLRTYFLCEGGRDDCETLYGRLVDGVRWPDAAAAR